MVWVPGGGFTMGSNRHYPEEAPARSVDVRGFWMDRFTVTNEEFARFVKTTGHVTLAEQPPDPSAYPGATPELLVPGSVVFRRPPGPVDLRDPYQWWEYVPGASWRQPRGPGSSIRGLDKHPVVHVAYADVEAYARWAEKSLPTEAEWEFAARGGLEDADYVWGDAFAPGGRLMANTWQGEFPRENRLEDGYEWTAPVGSFSPNGYGLYDMAGNVWQWTCDPYRQNRRAAGPCCAGAVPQEAHEPAERDGLEPAGEIPRKVTKGGSFLCAPNYCQRYRPAARMAQPIDTSTCHLGFRCIVRVEEPEP
jgi:formylglycine-generating enzyme required for sulfatase activity